MFPPQSVYPNSIHRITILFDRGDPRQRELFRSFRDAFGEHHAEIEALQSSLHACLHLYPGGARRSAA